MLKTKFVQPYTFNKYKQKFTTFPARAKAGVYLIKEGKDIVYIGHSTTDVYKTMYRHFQQWTHRQQEVTTYAGQDLDNFTVRVIYCTPKQAEAAEKYLIKKHKPRDNKYKYDSIILLPYDKKTGEQINDTPTAPNSAWKPDPRDMLQDYSDLTPDDAEPFDLFGVVPDYKKIAEQVHSDIEKILPENYTISKFRDGGGTYGVSYYAYIKDKTGALVKTIRLSDHSSGATSSESYITTSWKFPHKAVEGVKFFFTPENEIQYTQVIREFPTKNVLLKSYPNAQNIEQGEFTRKSKTGNNLYNFSFFIKSKTPQS